MSKLSIAVLAIVALASARPEAEQYTSKFDGIDYRAVVKNDRLFNSYFDCITHGTKCTPAGKELKANIPDAIATECSKCNSNQKEATNFLFQYLRNEKPELWKQLLDIYDHDGVYQVKYEARYKEKGDVV